MSLQDNQYLGNSARYGPEYGSYPKFLKLVNNNTDALLSLISGVPYKESIIIGIFDMNKQIVSTDSETECVMQSDEIGLTIGGNTRVRASQGYCNYTGIKFFGHPGS